MSHRTTNLEEVRRQAREFGLSMEESHFDSVPEFKTKTDPEPEPESPQLTPSTMDSYQTLAAQFRERTRITDADAQFKCLVEEVGELAEAMNCDEAIHGEIADVLITAFVLADVAGLDVREAYHDKMEYNLQKSGRKAGGKVLDDA